MYTFNYNININRICKKFACLFFSVIAIISAFYFNGCQKVFDEQIMLLGAPVAVYVADPNYILDSKVDRNMRREVYDLANELNSIFSIEENSEISAYNTVIGEKKVKISEHFYNVLSLSKELFTQSGGLFNPQVSHLVDLWGFTKRHKDEVFIKQKPYDRDRNSDGSFALPDQMYVDAFKSLTDFSFVTLTYDKDYFVTKPDQKVTVNGETYYSALDLSSVVKGYFCDLAHKIVQSYGIKNYYISAGGSSLYLSTRPNGSWDLQIVDPFSKNREAIISVPVSNKQVAASGTYQNYYTIDGVNYSHIIDPTTGAPTKSDLVSVTLIGEDGAKLDGLSTALINMGQEKGLEFITNYQNINYIFINNKGEIISDIQKDITYLK